MFMILANPTTCKMQDQYHDIMIMIWYSSMENSWEIGWKFAEFLRNYWYDHHNIMMISLMGFNFTEFFRNYCAYCSRFYQYNGGLKFIVHGILESLLLIWIKLLLRCMMNNLLSWRTPLCKIWRNHDARWGMTNCPVNLV